LDSVELQQLFYVIFGCFVRSFDARNMIFIANGHITTNELVTFKD